MWFYEPTVKELISCNKKEKFNNWFQKLKNLRLFVKKNQKFTFPK